MLPAAPPLLAPQAARWVRAAVPRWVTNVALPVLWLVAVVVAIAADTTRCTPQDPSVCGPDSSFAFAFVVLLAIPVLLWWMPVLGCVAGALFALADLRYDNIAAAKWAFGTLGLLCALVGWRLLRGAAEQRRIVATLGDGRAVPAAGGPSAGESRGAGRWLVAAALVLAGIGFFAWYGHQVSDEQAHLRRAVRVQARVVELRVDDSITVQTRTPSGGTRDYRIGVYDSTAPYPLHSSTPVLLDPRDPDWIRLVAEPQDVTYWQSAGAGCWLLALCWLLYRERWYRRLRALETGEQVALRVRIRPDEKGRALILPSLGNVADPGDDRPIGRLAVLAAPPVDTAPADGWEHDWEHDGWEPEGWQDDGWDHETQEAFGRTWRDEDPAGVQRFAPPPVVEDAVLIGALHDRGVAMLVTAEETLLPTGRLRVGGLRGWRQAAPGSHAASGQYPAPGPYPAPGQHTGPDPYAGPESREPGPLLDWWQRLRGSRSPVEPELFAGVAVQPTTGHLPDLPLTVRPQVRSRLIGAAWLVAAFVGYPVGVWLGELSLYQHVLLTLGLGRLAAAGAARLLSYLQIDHSRFEVSGQWWTYSVPWDRLHGVRRIGDRLSVAWQPDVITEVGPFDDPGGPHGRQERAERLGGAMLLLRQRALLGGLPGRQTSRRPSPVWIVLAGFAVLVLLTYWWR